MHAATDILLGYHSEEGWTAAIHLLTGHYGIEVEVHLLLVFAALCMSSGEESPFKRLAPVLLGLVENASRVGRIFVLLRQIACYSPGAAWSLTSCRLQRATLLSCGSHAPTAQECARF